MIGRPATAQSLKARAPAPGGSIGVEADDRDRRPQCHQRAVGEQTRDICLPASESAIPWTRGAEIVKLGGLPRGIVQIDAAQAL